MLNNVYKLYCAPKSYRSSFASFASNPMVGRFTTGFFHHVQVPASNFRNRSGSRNVGVAHTPVPILYKFMFRAFRVELWHGFAEEAARFMAGDGNERELDPGFVRRVKDSFTPDGQGPIQPENEGQLQIKLEKNVFHFLNSFKPAIGETLDTAYFVVPTNAGLSHASRKYNRKPDFVSRGMNDEDADVVGEIKPPPKVTLGERLSAEELTAKLQAPNFLKLMENLPFVQLFSYMFRSKGGRGILTNYDETRCFKMNLRERVIYMSPLIRATQVLRDNEPHLYQALLYLQKKDLAERRVFNDKLKIAIDSEATKQVSLHEISGAQRKQKESKGGSKSSETGPSSRKRNKKRPSWCCGLRVTRVLYDSELIGRLGYGLTGIVDEYLYKGMKVAVKFGRPFDPYKDEEDEFAHVKNEIKIYEALTSLHGCVIPQVVAAGVEKFFNPEYLFLITEKVGMELIQEDNGLYVGSVKMSHGNLKLLEEKGRKGLDAIHGCDVLHRDVRTANLRVNMKNGKVDRVWWIDFGISVKCYNEELMDAEKDEFSETLDVFFESQ